MPLGTVRAALRYADTSRDYADTQILGYGYEPQRIQIHERIPARPKATKRIVLGYPCHAHILTLTNTHPHSHTQTVAHSEKANGLSRSLPLSNFCPNKTREGFAQAATS